MKKLLTALFSALVFCCAAVPEQMKASLPEMKHRPVVDGTLSAGEWKDGIQVYGLVRHNSPYLSTRQGTLYFGMDREYFYFAAKTELPPEGVPLLNKVKKRDGAVYLDDNVEVVICPPDEKFVYQLIVNPAGVLFDRKYPVVNGGTTATDYKPWDPAVEFKSKLENGFWTLEARIPLKEFGLKGTPRPGDVWKVLAGRSWQYPAEQTTLKKTLLFSNPEEMALFQWNPGVPHVSFTGLGKDAGKGDFRIEFTVTNPSPEPREIQHRISVVSDAAPRSLDSTLTVPGGKTVPVVLEFSEKTNVIRTLSAEFKDLETGKVLYERTFIYDPALKTRWINPNQKRSAELEIGVYPYYKKVRARFGNPVEQVSGWQRGIFRIQQKNGTTVAERNGEKTAYGFETEFPFEPQAGEYILSAELTDANGKKVTKSRSFLIEKFPWEHNSIGCDRIIIPPFKAITCPTERSAEATLTGYRFRDGFFDRVTASDTENILAAPIRLTINGETVKETSFRFTEQSPDRIGTESGLRWSGGTVQVRGVMDYDGFYRFTMKFRPDGMQKINSAVLTVPLKKEYAKLSHSLCNRMKYNDAKFLPEKDGVIWRSSQSAKTPQLSGSFRPYVWIGQLEKGLAWMSESDQDWSLDPAGDALEVVALPDRTELRIHLVNLPTEWEKEFTLEQAFQATPVKPQPDYRRKLLERATLPNGWNLCTFAGSSCWGSWGSTFFFPLGKDYSFVNYLAAKKFTPESEKQIVSDFIRRHGEGLSIAQKNSLKRHLERGIMYAKQAKYKVPYLNARFSHLDWQEYKTYMDEWWCSDYRAGNADDYNNTPVKSYQDMALYYLRRLVREGMDGIYYDNIRDWSNPNPVTGPAWRRRDGQMQPYFDIFALREFVRRTAVMLYQEKKTFPDGRPVLTLHMTNTNLVPVLAFGTIALDLEAEYGSKDFQDRFTEGYLQSCTLGLQTGVIPEILVQITGKNREFVTRTFLAVTLAYDLPFVMNGGGLTGEWSKVWRRLYQWGYSTPEVKVAPCWDSATLKSDRSDWRITTYRKGKELVAAVSNFGDTAEGTLDLSGVHAVRAVDWESGRELPVGNGSLPLKLQKHDFRLIHITTK